LLLLHGLLLRRLVNARLRARYAQGLSVEVVDFFCEPLRESRVGLFMRCRFTLDDGDAFEIDTVEVNDMLRAWYAH
jgi:hypothetical protein